MNKLSLEQIERLKTLLVLVQSEVETIEDIREIISLGDDDIKASVGDTIRTRVYKGFESSFSDYNPSKQAELLDKLRILSPQSVGNLFNVHSDYRSANGNYVIHNGAMAVAKVVLFLVALSGAIGWIYTVILAI